VTPAAVVNAVPVANVAWPVPNELSLLIIAVPALMFVPPLYVFAPFRLTLPLPSFVKLPAPLITPFKLLSWVELCKVASPAKLIRLLTVTPAAVVNAVPVANVAWPVPNELSLLIIAVPALMFVPPLYVFAPFRLTLPLPSFVKLPAPLITPFKLLSWVELCKVASPAKLIRLLTVTPAAVVNAVPVANVAWPVPNELSLLIIAVPALMFVPPLYVFAPFRLTLPLPSFVKLPAPLITPFKLLSWVELCKVASPAKLIRLLTVTPAAVVNAVPVANVAWPVPNELSLLIIAVPALMFVPPLYVFAPFRLTLPLPSFVKLPAPLITPFKLLSWVELCKVASPAKLIRLLTVTPAAVVNAVPVANVAWPVPNELSLLIIAVPALMFVPPLYVFAPFRLTLPLPSFVKLPAPLITPFKLLSWVELCKVASPAKLIRLLTVTPAAVVNAVPVANVAWPVPNELSLLIIAVPALMFVPPLYVFAPFRLTLPLPSFVKLPAPLITPFKLLSWVELCKVASPAKLIRLLTVTPAAVVNAVPVANVAWPVPNELSLLIIAVPALMFVPPLYVFAPFRLTLPLPSFVKLPAPLITPFKLLSWVELCKVASPAKLITIAYRNSSGCR
jgi:hypothetical protein